MKKIPYIACVVIGIIIGVSAVSVWAQTSGSWTVPSTTPPIPNVATPINVGSLLQEKTGSVLLDGNFGVGGNFIISTGTPATGKILTAVDNLGTATWKTPVSGINLSCSNGVSNITISNGIITGGTCASIQHILTLTKSLAGGGTITSSPAGINCGISCSTQTATYSSGTAVNLTASPAAGYTFSGWSGACTGTGTCSITMSSDQSVTATFAVAPFDFSISANVPGFSPPIVPIVFQRGSSYSVNVSLSLTSGLTQPVSLSIPDAGDITYGFSSGNSCNPSCSKYLLLFTSFSSAIGSRTLTITGTGGGKTHSTSITFSFDYAHVGCTTGSTMTSCSSNCKNLSTSYTTAFNPSPTNGGTCGAGVSGSYLTCGSISTMYSCTCSAQCK